MTKFTSQFNTSKAEIGIAAWQEQSDVAYPDNRHITGTALLVVKLLDRNGAERDAQSEVENFLGTEEAERLADAYDLGYVGDYRFPTIPASDDTFFVWLNWTARRELEITRPLGESEWFGSRGIPNNGKPR